MKSDCSIDANPGGQEVLVLFLGALAVAAGAFGAHAWRGSLEVSGMMEAWKTAAHYHLAHAIALWVLVRMGTGSKVVWWLWLLGVILFSGSLYVMGLTGVRRWGAVTPVGGVLLLIGWMWIPMAWLRGLISRINR